jgi:hypothetical protein
VLKGGRRFDHRNRQVEGIGGRSQSGKLSVDVRHQDRRLDQRVVTQNVNGAGAVPWGKVDQKLEDKLD